MDDEMISVLENLKSDISEIKESQQLLYKVMNGNGKIGVITRVALIKESLTRAWITLTLLIGGIVGIAFYIIRCGMTGT